MAWKVFESLAGIANTASIYAASSLSTGALAAIVHEPLGLTISTAFVLGAMVALGPVYGCFASNWGMRRSLREWALWHQEGLIDDKDYASLKAKAMNWFIAKRFRSK